MTGTGISINYGTELCVMISCVAASVFLAACKYSGRRGERGVCVSEGAAELLLLNAAATKASKDLFVCFF